MIVGINACRIRSGGAVAHLKGLLNSTNFADHKISNLHVWTYPNLRRLLPKDGFIHYHTPDRLGKILLYDIFWEFFILPKQLKLRKCDILFNLDAGSTCRFEPSVTLSQDMLSYEKGEINRFGFSKERLRLIILRFVQNFSLKKATLSIFLTKYASKIIQRSSGKCRNVKIIAHGIDNDFKKIIRSKSTFSINKKNIQCLYISNAAPYKHQWHVVKAIEILRNYGYDFRLKLVGGGKGDAKVRLEKQILESDPEGNFVTQYCFVSKDEIVKQLSNSDLFIFASSCENLPVTLLEAMASGIPICSSDRGPMPEVLGPNGCYFNPECAESIAFAVRKIASNSIFQSKCIADALARSNDYTWEKCANMTFESLYKIYYKTSDQNSNIARQ